MDLLFLIPYFFSLILFSEPEREDKKISSENYKREVKQTAFLMSSHFLFLLSLYAGH